MTRLLAINVSGPSGALPAGTPIAVNLFSDAELEARPYHSGKIEEDGRLLFRFDGSDPNPNEGVNLEILAVPGCETWTGRGRIDGNEFMIDAIAGVPCDPPLLGVHLKEGNNPFA